MSGAPDGAPDFGRGFLRVPLSAWLSVFCRAPLTRRQLQLVSVVIRESWGWQRRGAGPYLWTRPLTTARFAEATGLATDRIGRDLRALVARGALRERDGCYQFVPDPSAWLPPAPRPAPLRRRRAPEPPPRTAASAPPTGLPKTAHRKQTNGGPAAERARAERFVRVVLGFVGPLSAGREAELRLWVARAGVRACWQRLEPGFRHGPATAAAFLAAALYEERARRRDGGDAGSPLVPS